VSFSALVRSEWFALFGVPLLIFFARIVDVTIGTMRIIFVARGLKLLAPVFGFFEVLIWLIAIGQVMANLTNWHNYIAYALGFAAGNYVGIYLESRIALGNQLIRIITRRDATALVAYLRSAGYTVTAVDAQGDTSAVKVIFTVISRRDLSKIVAAIKHFNPRAFYSVEDVRFVSQAALVAPKSAFAPHFEASAEPGSPIGELPDVGEVVHQEPPPGLRPTAAIKRVSGLAVTCRRAR
jgi:uncharacterized protein YebE (UPF0316 family)